MEYFNECCIYGVTYNRTYGNLCEISTNLGVVLNHEINNTGKFYFHSSVTVNDNG